MSRRDRDRRIEPWRVLAAGRRVRVASDSQYVGVEGFIVEKLGDSISGMARYVVQVDMGQGAERSLAEGTRFDACRYELKQLRERYRGAELAEMLAVGGSL